MARGTTRETDKEKIQRMERQMDRLKFKMARQREVMEAEIVRQKNHIDRGRELLHRVTSQIGQKQDERDRAVNRLEAVMTMLACIIGSEPVLVPIEEFKETMGNWGVKVEQIEGGYLLSTEEVTKEAETDGETTDTVPPVVPASDEEGNPGQPGPDILPESQPSIPTDQ